MDKTLLINPLNFVNCRSTNIHLNFLRMSCPSDVSSPEDMRLWKGREEEGGMPKGFIVLVFKAEASCFGTRMKM